MSQLARSLDSPSLASPEQGFGQDSADSDSPLESSENSPDSVDSSHGITLSGNVRKSRAGRPPIYRPEFAEHARKLCLLGSTNEQLADFFGVTRFAVDEWIKTIQEFSIAVKSGRELADAEIAASLYKKASGYEYTAERPFVDKNGGEHVVQYKEHVSPDTAAAFIWLKNRRPDLWRDRIDVNHHGAEKLAQLAESMTRIFHEATRGFISTIGEHARLTRVIDGEFSEVTPSASASQKESK